MDLLSHQGVMGSASAGSSSSAYSTRRFRRIECVRLYNVDRQLVFASIMNRRIGPLLVYSCVTLSAQLPPEIQLDRHMRRANAAVAAEDYAGAKEALQGAAAIAAGHGLDLPDDFHFRRAETAYRTGSLGRAEQFVTRYLTLAGREGTFYEKALELLDIVEADGYREEDLCTDEKKWSCWQVLESPKNCRFWRSGDGNRKGFSWNGACVGGLANGQGVLSHSYVSETLESTHEWTGRMLAGRFQGVVTGLEVDNWIEDGRIDRSTASIPFERGEKHGVVKTFFEDGTLRRTSPWFRGERHGTEKSFTADGQIVFRVEFVDGEQHGKEERFNRDGTLSDRWNFVRGKIHGYVEWFHDNGTLKSRTPWVDSQRHGMEEEFREDGTLLKTVPWVNGNVRGTVESFREDGSLERATPFIDGEAHGLANLFHEDGWLQATIPYVKGEAHGLAEALHKNGTRAARVFFVNGKKHGLEEHFDEDGLVSKTIRWNNGVEVD